jgi:hypothetical protein
MDKHSRRFPLPVQEAEDDGKTQSEISLTSSRGIIRWKNTVGDFRYQFKRQKTMEKHSRRFPLPVQEEEDDGEGSSASRFQGRPAAQAASGSKNDHLSGH